MPLPLLSPSPKKAALSSAPLPPALTSSPFPPFPPRFIKKLEHSWKALVHDGVSSPPPPRRPLPKPASLPAPQGAVWGFLGNPPWGGFRELSRPAETCFRRPRPFLAPQDTVSVHRPSFYAERFQQFMSNVVFKKIPRE